MKESILHNLQEWEKSQGLVGFTSYNISRSLQELLIQLQELKSETGTTPKVILVEPDPLKFITYFFAGIIGEVDLFLGNPDWQTQEWEQVFKLVKPDLIWGTSGAREPRTRSWASRAPRQGKHGEHGEMGWRNLLLQFRRGDLQEKFGLRFILYLV